VLVRSGPLVQAHDPTRQTQASKPVPLHGIKIMQQPNQARDIRREAQH
jgi:hypothetical protein